MIQACEDVLIDANFIDFKDTKFAKLFSGIVWVRFGTVNSMKYLGIRNCCKIRKKILFLIFLLKLKHAAMRQLQELCW